MQLMKMFLLVVVGYVCFQRNLITHEGTKSLSNLLLYVVNPMMIVHSFSTGYTDELLEGFLWAFALAFLSMSVAILVSHFLISNKRPSYEIERFACVYPNCGFMGIPLAMSLFGSTGVLYISAYVAVFNLLSWTHGYALMTGKMDRRTIRKGILSPAVIAVIVGLIIFLGDISLPVILSDTIDYLSCMNTALAMLIAGSSLAESDLLSALKNKNIYFIAVIRLFLLPAIMACIFHFLPLDRTVLITILVSSACPTATTITLFALRFDKNHQYASEIFAFSTVFSMVTIPIIMLLADVLL